MSAAGLLRRYLRQQAELGERELVLERLTPGQLVAVLNRRAVEQEAAGSGVGTREVVPRVLTTHPEAPPPTSALAARAASAPTEAAAILQIAPLDAAAVAAAGLEELRSLAAGCVACELCHGRNTVVFGDGYPTAELMIVGEAPDTDEDREGRPLVGRAGRLLDRFLQSIGYPRETVYVCNVVKCRAPSDRTPTPEEVAACAPIFRRQVELVGPRAILAVGTFPAQTLLGSKQSIGQLRGQVHAFEGVPLVATYHPAAVLRNPAWIRPVWEDLQRVRSVIESV